MGGYGGYGGGIFGLGVFFMLLFWALVIFAIVALVKRASGHEWHSCHPKKSGEKSAIDILKERYAKGEVNKQEFEEKKKDLE